MNVQLMISKIEQLCGPDHYDRGAQLARDGKVSLIDKDGDLSNGMFRMAVESGGRSYQVIARFDRGGSIVAECTCLAFYADDHYCKHAAAALIWSMENGGESTASAVRNDARGKVYLSSESDHKVAEGLLRLFREQPSGTRSGARMLRDGRERLSVEFAVQLLPIGNGRHRFGIELKAGPDRLYVVQNIRGFVDSIARGTSHSFTKLFAYDPKRHTFTPEDDRVLQLLAQLIREEEQNKHALYRSGYLPTSASPNDRILLIVPYLSEELLRALTGVRQAKIELYEGIYRKHAQPSATYTGVRLADAGEKLPLRFALDRDAEDEGYVLTADGMSRVVVLDGYGMTFLDGRFYPMDMDELERLGQMKGLLTSSTRDSEDAERIAIAPEQIELLMERAIPGLAKLGQVQVSEAIANRIVYKPLQARMYLDRLRGRLLAGLEFQYGDIVINPLDPSDKPRGADRILMREPEKEQDILALMEDEQFGRTEGGYIMEGDDAEFHFLHHVVPLLERHLTIYATSAVKLRVASDVPPLKLHIAWEERTDWLHFQFKMDGITEKEIKAIVRSVEEKRQYYKLASGALLPLDTEGFQALLRVMNGVGLHQPLLFDDSFSIPVPIGRAFALLDEPLENGAVKLGRSLRELLDNLRHPDQLEFPVPERLAPVLRDYQKYGYQWMKTLAQYRFGGILADEMGLGKTVQSIAYLVSAKDAIRESGQPALIVAPASLVYNWRNELARFAPELTVMIADGSKRERVLAVGAGEESADVLITSYPLLRRDREHYAERKFHTLILDEAQAFKNDTTQTAGAVRQLRADYKFALTGTPIENRLEELWSIFRAVFPELLPGKKEFGDLTRESVAKRCRPFLLRRLKSDVLKELPEKIETTHASELLPEQKKLYAAYLAKLRQDSLKHLDSDDFGRARIRILAGITRLRQLCCHPSLFVEGYQGSSAKFEQLLELVEECRSSGKRALIFSQFTEMLELIKRELAYRGMTFFYLDGSTPPAERVELCGRFNAGERDLFLLSLKAGGTGLNLTGADTVILYDLWWNPAVEQQAADRAHRIGQKNVVQIIRLVAEGTVEDKMYELQQRKKSLIDDVIEPGSEAISSLTENDIREILSLETL
ncbi:DEAD/DEAH box helicase [Paenibacillus soyae]|uniref:DEAD/DEAH box helicase n=1 Tax=Paenibacillus soyae TaxID=2969249 RepID=A0A9X2MMF1_9BACL|nr:DEAD/DEAH box helicase [Paenibacillus soyae]MCR2804568.1 DEAD/DEAH box helicase [Paenibacillus soyae]